MDWDNAILEFKEYLRIERSLSNNSIEAYEDDLTKLKHFFELTNNPISPINVSHTDIQKFIIWVNEFGISARSQSRILSGIRTFYKYLLIENLVDNDPTALIDSPRIGKKLPTVLSIQEIDNLINVIDLSKSDGHRNRAILETLYSCGLRVSELVELRISDIHFDSGFVKVVGKGNKERLVPISEKAIKEITNYLPDRNIMLAKADKANENIMFLNNRGKRLTRVMIFTIIKNLAESIGLKKKISPHTFRHSFASHMVDGGADLRAVQEMLGHESILTTEIYTHLDREYLRDAILRFHPRAQKQKKEN